MFAAAAPAPLFRIYAGRWRFSALTLTVVFALYAIGLLAALRLVYWLVIAGLIIGAAAVVATGETGGRGPWPP